MAVVLFLCLCYPVKKRELTPRLKLTVPSFPGAPGKYFELPVVYLVSSSRCWENLHRAVLEALLFPVGCPVLWTGLGLVLWDKLVT